VASPNAKDGSVSPAVASFAVEEGQRLAAAYEVCREIARREAKNFYYAFRALPKPKRDAICAVYAFMRHADDLSDDESLPHADRRRALEAWMTAWHEAERGRPTDDPVFVALADAQRRFRIPSELLDQLVRGTAMDLERPESQPRNVAVRNQSSSAAQAVLFDVYPTFDDLYRYCYLVASVVGLVCIRIFGYEDAHAEKLAEETGIAFQLTNILRDIREDADRGRIYLPLEDMERLGVTAEELTKPRPWTQSSGGLRELLKLEAGRAERYYESGRKLLPLIAADSRPAMWVLITIYHRLLERIERRDYDVFSSRVSVPTREKLWILACGLLQVFAYRLSGA
jgi:15-cis-phytoene synthase